MMDCSFDNKNILFIYSGLQDNTLDSQNNIVFIKQLIGIIKQNNIKSKFVALTITDGLYLALDDDVLIIQDKITRESIINTIRAHKINIVIPIIGDKITEKIFTQPFLQKERVNVLHSDYYYKKPTKTTCKKNAKRIGFKIEQCKTFVNKTNYTAISFICINDCFHNTIIFDILSVAKIGTKKILASSMFKYFLNEQQCKTIITMIKQLGKQIPMQNITYQINILIDEKSKVIFNNIQYGTSEEIIFSYQTQKINIANIEYKLLNKQHLSYDVKNQYIAYSFDYNESLKIRFASNINELTLDLPDIKNEIITNSKLLSLFNKPNSINNKIDIINNFNTTIITNSGNINTKINFQSSQKDIIFNLSQISIQDEYILILFDENRLKSIDHQIIFMQICETLRKRTNKKLIILSKYLVPIIDLYGFQNIHIYNNITQEIFTKICDHYKIKHMFLNVDNNTQEFVFLAKKNNIKIYGLEYNDTVFYHKTEIEYSIFLHNIKSSCKSSFKNIDKNETLEVFCCRDNFGNIFLPMILGKALSGENSIQYIQYPPEYENFEVEDKINQLVSKIHKNINTSGMLQITCSYSNGELLLLNISLIYEYIPFLITKDYIKKNNIFEVICKCLLKENIDVNIRNKDNKFINPPFYKNVIFLTNNNKTVKLKGITLQEIVKNFQKMINRK